MLNVFMQNYNTNVPRAFDVQCNLLSTGLTLLYVQLIMAVFSSLNFPHRTLFF